MKIILSDRVEARCFGHLYGVDIHHSDGGVTRMGFLLHPEERWTSHDEALAAGKQEIAYRTATSPGAKLAEDGLSYTAAYGHRESETRVEVFHENIGRGVVLSTPPELCWAGADGGEARLVGALPDGRRVVVVKRIFGDKAYARHIVPRVTPYWTSVVESAPRSEKPLPYVETRFWSMSVAQHVSRSKAVRAALLKMGRDDQSPESAPVAADNRVARALREYGYLAGVTNRTHMERVWVNRLYGLLIACGEDVREPEPTMETHRDIVRDGELTIRLGELFAEVQKEARRDR